LIKKVAFLVKILVVFKEKHKKVKKALKKSIKIVKKSNFALKTNAFLRKKAGNLGNPGFSEIFDFAVVSFHFPSFSSFSSEVSLCT